MGAKTSKRISSSEEPQDFSCSICLESTTENFKLSKCGCTLGWVYKHFFSRNASIMVSSTWVPKRRSHTNFQLIWPTRGRPPRLQSFGLAVLEVDFSRSEFWLEIKILLCKSSSGNTKMASELEFLAKQKICQLKF